MRCCVRAGCAFLLAVPTAIVFSRQPSDVVVVRVGDGSTVLSTAAAAVFLERYAPDGTSINCTALRDAVQATIRSPGAGNGPGGYCRHRVSRCCARLVSAGVRSHFRRRLRRGLP